MNANSRESLDIMEDILNVTMAGARKTAIIYKANLNHSRASKYLKELLDKELLEVDEEPVTYSTTEKGRNFLKKYKEIKEIIKE